MGKDVENNEEGSVLDIWNLDHSVFSTEDDADDAEDIVREGDDVEEVPQDKIENDEEAEAIDSEPGEDTDPEGAEKPAEEEEESDENDSAEGEEEPESGEEPSELKTILEELVEDDVLIYDEEKEYELSNQGLKDLVSETIEKKSKEVLETFKAELPDKAKELLEVLEKGASVDDFVSMEQEVDFSKVPLENAKGEPLERNQELIVEDWLKIQGFTQEEIQETIADYKGAGLLGKQASISKNKLTNWQSEKNETFIKQKEAEKAQKIEEDTKAAVEFEKEVTSATDISGFKISKQKAKKLHEFITVPDKEGKTGFQKADSDENRLLYAFMAMEGFDKEKLVKSEITKKVIQLKKKLSNHQDSMAKPKRGGEQIRKKQATDVVKGIKWEM